MDQQSQNELGEKIHDKLCSQVRWLEAEYVSDQWKLEKCHERMAVLEAHLAKLETPEVVDLTQEEDEGGVGGPIILAEKTPAPESVVPQSEGWDLNSEDKRALVGLLVGIALN